MKDRILAIDYGDSKIGTAHTDALGITIQPGNIIYTKGSIKKAVDEIKKIIVEKNIKEIVIGMPYNTDGSEGFRADKTNSFIKRLTNNLKYSGFENVKINIADERYTSLKADDALRQMNISQKKGKKIQDSLAAYYILDEYLKNKESQENEKNN